MVAVTGSDEKAARVRCDRKALRLRTGEEPLFMDEDLVTELNELGRRIAADEYTIALARASGGSHAAKVSLEEGLRRRIADSATRMDALCRAREPLA